MPRDGSQIYHIPPGTEGIPDTTIESDRYNAFVHDVEQDLNAPRPIIAGGTGADDADEALANLKAEKASQLVTNYDSHAWVPGSFYSATTATNPPVASHAFAGVVYTNGTDYVVEATDLTDAAHKKYIRAKVGGTWSSWTDETGDKVAKSGDTMTGDLTISKDGPTLNLDKTNATFAAQIFGKFNNVNRWFIQLGDSTAEGGGNTGSDFKIFACTDAGGAAAGNAPITIRRNTGLMEVKADPTAALGVVTKQYVDTAAAFLDNGMVHKAGQADLAGSFHYGINQYNSRFSARRASSGADFEWGHANTAGYGCTLAYDYGAGIPFIGFYCGPGTTNNTYKTLGLPGCVLKPDGGGGFTFYNIPLANADNQALGNALFWVTNAGAVAGASIASAAEYQSNAANKLVGTNTVWNAAGHVLLDVSGASITPNFAAGINFNASITAINKTLANPTNAKAGQSGTITIYNGVGGVTISSWGSLYKFPGGVKPSPSQAGGAFDVLSYVVQGDGTIFCTYANGMA